MLLEHQGKRPRIYEAAYFAPTATLCGDVTIGVESRVLFGAVLVAEGGPSPSAGTASSWNRPCYAALRDIRSASVTTSWSAPRVSLEDKGAGGYEDGIRSSSPALSSARSARRRASRRASSKEITYEAKKGRRSR
jgi:hypothetical protein